MIQMSSSQTVGTGQQLRGQVQISSSSSSSSGDSAASLLGGLAASAAAATVVVGATRSSRRAQPRSSTVACRSGAFANMPASVKPGVVTGKALTDLLDYAKEKGFAIPGVNVVGHSSINACMEAAAEAKGPIIVTLSHGGGLFIRGKAVGNDDEKAAIAGTVS